MVIKRQGGQAQFSPLLAEPGDDDSLVSRLKRHVLDNIGEAFCVRSMSEWVAMSPRNFSRLFLRETGMTPMHFLQSARIDHARRLLETSTVPLKTVAFASGLKTCRQMNNLFRERLGLSAMQYRQQFG